MNRLPLALMALCVCFAYGEAATLRPNTTLRASTVRLSDLFDGIEGKADRVLGPGPGPGGASSSRRSNSARSLVSSEWIGTLPRRQTARCWSALDGRCGGMM